MSHSLNHHRKHHTNANNDLSCLLQTRDIEMVRVHLNQRRPITHLFEYVHCINRGIHHSLSALLSQHIM